MRGTDTERREPLGNGLSLTIPERRVRLRNVQLLAPPDDPDGLITTDSKFLSAIFTRGPLAFDDAQQRGEELSMRVVRVRRIRDTKRLRLDDFYTFGRDGGDITYTVNPVISHETHFDSVPELTESMDIAGSSIFDTLHVLTHYSFENYSAYKAIPAIPEAYRRLGMIRDQEKGTARIPVPSVLVERIEEARVTDTSGVYYPNIKVHEQGDIAVKSFVQSYAEGRHPVGAMQFYEYCHDIGQEHFQTLLTYGEPLMDLMQLYAQTVKSDDPIDAYNT